MEPKRNAAPIVPPLLNLCFACAGSVTATTFCHPFDVARVRAMVSGSDRGWIRELIQVAQTERIAGLWTGLSAGLLRQLFYGTARFGTFETLQDLRRAKYPKAALPAGEKIICGVFAGAIAGVAGNFPDVALTRMTSDKKLPVSQQRGYRNGVDAMIRIFREDGVRKGLMCGVIANVQRSMLVNGVMLGTYAQSKEGVQSLLKLDSKSWIPTFIAGNVAGFLTALVAVPADFCKTKLQHALPGQFKGALDVMTKTVKEKGPLGLWAGFTPFWFKLAPHTTISFLIIETCRDLYTRV